MKLFNAIMKQMRHIDRAFKNKPVDKITIGVDVRDCASCEYKMRCAECSLSTENARLRAELASYKSSEITAGAIRQSADEAEKPSFDWEGFKAGKFAVHCDTEEKAKAFLNECAERLLKWGGDDDCRDFTNWREYREMTCYHCVTGPFIMSEHSEWYKSNGIKVISYTFPDTSDDIGSSGTTD